MDGRLVEDKLRISEVHNTVDASVARKCAASKRLTGPVLSLDVPMFLRELLSGLGLQKLADPLVVVLRRLIRVVAYPPCLGDMVEGDVFVCDLVVQPWVPLTSQTAVPLAVKELGGSARIGGTRGGALFGSGAFHSGCHDQPAPSRPIRA